MVFWMCSLWRRHGFLDVLHYGGGMLLVQEKAMPSVELEQAKVRFCGCIGGLAVAVRHQRAPHFDVRSGHKQVLLCVHELA